MPREQQTLRKEFEAWHKQEYGCFDKAYKLVNGEYPRNHMNDEARAFFAGRRKIDDAVETQKNAERYLKLRRMAVELSLSHQVISQFVTNQGELDAAIADKQGGDNAA